MSGQSSFLLVIAVFCLIIAVVMAKLPPAYGGVIVVGIIVFMATFMSTEAGLYLLICSMLLSPEFGGGGLGGDTTASRGVTIRGEDMLLVLLGFAWLIRTAADLFSMVSREIDEVGEVEGFGIVCLEANAVGTAVLAGRSGGVEDAIADGQSGLLVDPEDLDAVVEAIVRLLQDDDLRYRLGAEGQQRVWAEFDREVQAERLWEACV